MEHISFIVTALTCAFIGFVTWCDRKAEAQKTGVEEKIVQAIQPYVDTKIEKCKQEIARNTLKKQEHIAQCLIYRSVHVVEEIQGLNFNVVCNQSMSFDGVHVYDWN